MLKKIASFILILLIAVNANATQILISAAGSTQGASLTRYMPVTGHHAGLYTTDAAASTIMPAPGVIDLLNVKISGTAGSNRTFTLYKNGSPTTLTCPVTAAATTCADSSNSVSYAAGDTISMEVVTIASGSTRSQGFSLRFTPTTSKQSIFMYTSNAANYATSNYATLNGSISPTSTETNNAVIMPEASATISKMYCSVDSAPGAGTSVTFTSRNNTAGGNLSCAIADAATSNSDLSNSDTIATAGDPYATLITVSGAAAAAPFKVSYVYTTPTCGNFPLPATGAGTALNTGAVRYFPVMGVRSGNTIETVNDTADVTNAFTMKASVVRLSAAPGSGKSWAVAFRIASADSALVNTISDATVVQTATQDVTVNAGDILTTGATPSGTPASSLYKATYIGNISTDSCTGAARRRFF